MSEPTPTTDDVAADFTALWLAGKFRAAGEKYWADDVVSIEPHALPDGADQVCRGIEAVRARNLHWLATHGIEDLSVDGPFVTGDHFALFADMLIAHAGRRTPHSRIAVFAVRNGQIIEERFFYE
ncbi:MULTISPECIES: SnoaL-like domain-containing protein [unclassified Wenzhouxiangella]|uniref:SnoaL-like domain-containing protein n=1 Tax=unclassified Wenzhouxiangella TaxID=2613841 RepID=UPI000E32AEEA|nr:MULTISPECIES: SnoaL-like domain-containing protein [unclassified Wenzhouxiangella]RFF28252.1 nuclear transport factor 2 family protein [Wenzhouxiangella sp. 15181]RFP69390.1 nuclear transport factor 2 family protein [Wenzhouxiangella sp. 15190]